MRTISTGEEEAIVKIFSCVPRRVRFGIRFATAILMPALSATWAMAASRDYTLVTNQSSIALSGNVVNTTLGTAPIQAQGAGGLTTTYSGTIKTDRVGNTIAFVDGSLVDANVSGNWRPKADATDGTAPADYGAKVSYAFGIITVNFAGRDLVAGLTSGPLAIDGSGTFDLSTATVNFVTGNIAYRDSLATQFGTDSFAGESGALTGTGILSSSTNSGQTTETLTFPVNSTFAIAVDTSTTVNLTLTGQLVAKATFTPLWGDYNENGVVDAADYVLWRDHLGSAAALPNDDTAGVGMDDYDRWRSKFGVTGSGAGASALGNAAVPEASAISLIAMVATVLLGNLCRHRRHPI